jgi:glycosyltransferase involved in cell wall biosynthesis
MTEGLVSVIIPTRNRPSLLKRAVAGVTAQTYDKIELIVVDDGSNEDHASRVMTLLEDNSISGQLVRLNPVDPGGSGPSVARNAGIAVAHGELIAFCDDDDEWIDASHLLRAWKTFARESELDFYFGDQEAVQADEVKMAHWLPWLNDAFPTHGSRVTPSQVLRANLFPHLNTVVVRRSLIDAVEGFDVTLRYSEDLYFSLLCLDAARAIYFHPHCVARHHIPDQTKAASASTRLSVAEKRLQYLHVCSKARVNVQNRYIQRCLNHHEGQSRKEIAKYLVKLGRWDEARTFARSALVFAFTWKWLLFTLYIRARAWFGSLNIGRTGGGRTPRE